ncbi:MAG: hypothetical protein R2838_21020 [Caldilineaceae bacterium]
MTSLLQILVQPIGTAALSRMPDPLTSLAVWPVVYELLIFLMSTGIAFTEVVVIMLESPRAPAVRCSVCHAAGRDVVGHLLLIAATPLADVWFGRIVALPTELVAMAHQAVWFCLLVPGLARLRASSTAFCSTASARGITEGVFLGLLTMTVVLVAGITTGAMTGVNVAALALTLGASTRVAWLWYQSRPARRVSDAGCATGGVMREDVKRDAGIKFGRLRDWPACPAGSLNLPIPIFTHRFVSRFTFTPPLTRPLPGARLSTIQRSVR